jgi:outer membrane protein OmpA-like peptidoglycan-associated protein
MLGCAHDPPPSRNVHFDSAKSEPRSPDDYVTLGRALALLDENPKLHLLVVGHTDADGSDDFNRDLAFTRATNVRGELLERDPTLVHRIETAYFGKARPIADNDTPDGKAKNRRVELYFYYPEIGTAREVQLQREFGGSLEFEASASVSIR